MLATEEKSHAKFSASAAARWIACPGSIQLSEKAPRSSKSNSYAEEGTRAHAVLEILLKGEIANDKSMSPAQLLKKGYSREMIEHALAAFHAIMDMAPKHAEILSETKCKLDFIHEDMGGTTDCAIVEPYGKLIVIDFKYGAIPVDPEQNPQLIAYALGIAHRYDYEFQSVELVVIQPRSLDAEENGIVKKWETSIASLKDWAEKFKDAKDQALSEYPPFQAGDDHCKYCPAATICPELRDKSLKTIQADFDDETGAMALPEVSQHMPVKNLGVLLQACDRLETWIGKLREHAFHVLEQGGQVSGFKLVQKRSIRKWADADATAKEVRQKYAALGFTEPELLSPAQFEKQVGNYDGKEVAQAFVAARTVSTSSGVTIAPESDPRPAFNFFEAEFKSLDEPTPKLTKSIKTTKQRGKKK